MAGGGSGSSAPAAGNAGSNSVLGTPVPITSAGGGLGGAQNPPSTPGTGNVGGSGGSGGGGGASNARDNKGSGNTPPNFSISR